jgi:AraC family transcriptional regulator
MSFPAPIQEPAMTLAFDVERPAFAPPSRRAAAEPIMLARRLPREQRRPLHFDGPTLNGLASDAPPLARLFGLESAPTFATTTLKSAQITVSRLAGDGAGLSAPLPAERAYGVWLQLKESADAELWKLGRPTSAAPFAAGSIVIAQLEDEPRLRFPAPFDVLFIHLPRIAFDELAQVHGAPRIDALADQAGTLDPVVHDLGRALLQSLQQPSPPSPLFFDHVAFALYARLAERYGRTRREPTRRPGALTAWQERVAKEALAADLGEAPSLARAAGACGLSVARLARAFRATTGMPPYRWLRSVRVERAKALLLDPSLALAQIAYDCGFADQSHFTRVFTAAIGVTPGAWRRGRLG